MSDGAAHRLIPWLPDSYRGLIVAPGAIGQAMADVIGGDPHCADLIVAGRGRDPHVDLTDEASIADLVKRVGAPLHLLICAGGLLHDDVIQPEKALRDCNPEAMARLYAVNSIGPAILVRQAEKLIPRDQPACFAMLGGRVGSIGDNRLGGWFSYRMAKAAAAQFVRTLSIEWRRTRPLASALLLHPGTVDSPLSAPFQRNVTPGKLFTPGRSAEALLDVIGGAGPERSGEHIAWDGTRIPA